MNSYEFGRMVYSRSNVAQVRAEIMRSVQVGGGACEAVNGFVSVMRESENKSGAERKFLRQFDAALKQLTLKAGAK